MRKSASRLTGLLFCALFAALCAVCSQIAIPLPWGVPINFATAIVFLAGGLLGPWQGALSMLIYVAIGAIGAPVFTNFHGGLAYMAGPTGGYIIGYIFVALSTGLIARRRENFFVLCGAMVIGLVACYTLGTAWFAYSTGRTFWQSLLLCVVPYLPGDIAKIALSAFLCQRLRPAINKYIF